jgi:predicted aspartyl protease
MNAEGAQKKERRMPKVLLIIGFALISLTGAACSPGSLIEGTAPSTAAVEGPERIRFDMANNDSAILIPVELNGQGPFQFVLDTGATLTCIDEELAAELQLPEHDTKAVTAGVKGAGVVRLVEVESMRVGSATASGLTACALDLQRMEAFGLRTSGLLGLNFLTAFQIGIDFQENTLELRTPENSYAGR